MLARRVPPALLLLAANRLAAQSPADSTSLGGAVPGACRGEMVSAVDIRPGRPPFSGAARWWRTAARAAGLHHVTTKERTVASYLDVKVGEPCTELRRAESERVLRAQPFLADATVRAEPDSGGTVRIVVTTVDEVPVLVSGRLRKTSPQALALGNGNAFGLGISVLGGVERGGAYRTGYALQLTHYAFLGRPVVLGFDAERAPTGGHVAGEVAHPFLTDLQSTTWHVGARRDHDYLTILRPARDGLAVSVRETAWDASFARRIRLGHVIALAGAALTRDDIDPDGRGIRVTSDGFRPDTGMALTDRWAPFRATRLAAIAGLRRVRYVTVRGFDALTATQDVPVGAELVALGGRGLGGSLGSSDYFTSGSLYAGAARPSWRLAGQVTAEARHDMNAGRWDDLITSARVAWYLKESPRATLVVGEEVSSGVRSIAPVQLTLGARDGGVRGFSGAWFGGERRLVTRIEQRYVLGSPRGRGDLGVAAFTDIGELRAGSAPYGTNVTRASVGVSLLGAFPVRSKRLYRIDLAIPVASGEALGGGGHFELRLTSDDLTRRFWRDPGDVSAARIGAVPSSVMAWPTR